MSKPFQIEPLSSSPKFLGSMAQKINRLVRAVRILGRIEGDGPIKITYSDSNVKIGLQRPLGEEIAIAAGRVVRGSPAAGETYSQVKSALESAYTASSLTPQVGDVIELGDAELLYLVRPDDDATDTAIPGQSGDDIDRVKVVVGGETVTAYRLDGAGEAGETRTFRYSMTFAGDFPTPSEMTTALQEAYADASLTPLQGDLVGLTSGGAVVFWYSIWNDATGNNAHWSRNFVVGSETYGATGWQTGLI